MSDPTDAARAHCAHVCVSCGELVDPRALIDERLTRFFLDVHAVIIDHARRALGVRSTITAAEQTPLPRLTRAERIRATVREFPPPSSHAAQAETRLRPVAVVDVTIDEVEAPDEVDDVEAAACCQALDLARARSHVVIVEAGADRRADLTRQAPELPAPALIVDGRLVRPADGAAWHEALRAGEVEHGTDLNDVERAR